MGSIVTAAGVAKVEPPLTEIKVAVKERHPVAHIECSVEILNFFFVQHTVSIRQAEDRLGEAPRGRASRRSRLSRSTSALP